MQSMSRQCMQTVRFSTICFCFQSGVNLNPYLHAPLRWHVNHKLCGVKICTYLPINQSISQSVNQSVSQGWIQVQATVLKSKSKYLDIFQVHVQVQVQSLCYVLKPKSKYISLYLSTSTSTRWRSGEWSVTGNKCSRVLVLSRWYLL